MLLFIQLKYRDKCACRNRSLVETRHHTPTVWNGVYHLFYIQVLRFTPFFSLIYVYIHTRIGWYQWNETVLVSIVQIVKRKWREERKRKKKERQTDRMVFIVIKLYYTQAMVMLNKLLSIAYWCSFSYDDEEYVTSTSILRMIYDDFYLVNLEVTRWTWTTCLRDLSMLLSFCSRCRRRDNPRIVYH